MKLQTVLGGAIFVISGLLLANGEPEPKSPLSGHPTHIIKFKSGTASNISFAHEFLISRHRAYITAAKAETDRSPKSLVRIAAKSESSGTQKSDKHKDKNDSGNEEDDEDEDSDDEDENDEDDSDSDKKDTRLSATSMELQLALEPISIDNQFVAMSGVFQDTGFIDTLHSDDAIEYVEPNQIYSVGFVLPEQGERNTTLTFDSSSHLKKRESKMATSVSWGLSRIHKRQPGSLNQYSYDETAGQGVSVYILDTGVNIGHDDFEGRAIAAANFVSEESDTDQGGHGTHVAATVAGKVFGVAKAATIKSVKILNRSGDGTTSALLRAIAFVVQEAKNTKSVINLSLSGPKSRILNEALSKVVNEYNIPVFVASGNTGANACNYSPSSNPDVFTVGATDINDRVASYSNIGECVTLYAPGSDIKSAWIGSKDAVKSLDGTSMANPHASGIAASLLSKYDIKTPAELYKMMIDSATDGALSFSTGSSSSNNLLAYQMVQ